VFYQLELIREPSPQLQFVPSVPIEASNLFCLQSLIVLIDSHSLDYPIDLATVSKEVYFAELIEDSLLSIGTQVKELVFLDRQLRRPGRRHV
jgi:hypothetical protein